MACVNFSFSILVQLAVKGYFWGSKPALFIREMCGHQFAFIKRRNFGERKKFLSRKVSNRYKANSGFLIRTPVLQAILEIWREKNISIKRGL